MSSARLATSRQALLLPLLLAALLVLSLSAPPGAAGLAPATSASADHHRAARADTDGDGLADEVDGCPTVASSNPTGCPSASRTARLRWREGAERLEARISSPVTACSSRARIKLWLARPGRADKLLAVDASYAGRHRFRVKRGATYYVTVSASYVAGQAECGAATSRKVRVPRR